MPTNISELNAKWRYFEGTTSSATILQDLAKVMCLGVRSATGDIIIERNWDIIYPIVNTNTGDYIAPTDKNNLSPTEFKNKVENQLRSVTNKVILKTTINTAASTSGRVDDLTVESDLNTNSLTMYVELYKPEYLADPEKYSPETERIGILPRLKVYDERSQRTDEYIATDFQERLVLNNHYIYMRAFDSIVSTYDAFGRVIDINPKEEVIDEFTGMVVETKCHISEWAKFAWYQDFEELNIDANDIAPGTTDYLKGVEFIPVNTPGLNSETRFNFYMNTNNERTVIVLTGNPSLDFTKNSISKHLIAFAYMGRVESFDGSINDTVGNFALTTSSSTVPCKTVQTVLSKMITDINDDASWVDNKVPNVPNAIDVADGAKTRFTMNLQYAYEPGSLEIVLESDNGQSVVNKLLYSVNKNLLEFVNPPKRGSIIRARARFIICEVQTLHGVTRDSFGNVIDTKKPDKYGKNTATCVTDIGMNHTRSKAYWQTHKVMFNTTEEFMTKENYGKSAYTGEYYADKIKITHANDGPRGMLEGCIVIDRSSLYALDELVVNRSFGKRPDDQEEVYIYFPITADYSFLSTGPNSLSGVALLKDLTYPDPKDDDERMRRVLDDLYIGRITAIVQDFPLPVTSLYGATIVWEAQDVEVDIFDAEGVQTGTAQAIDVETTPGTAKITRPGRDAQNATVVLTAKIKIGEVEATKEFYCVVVREGLSDAQAVAADKEWLDLAKANDKPDLDNVTYELMLPTLGPNETYISWISSDTSIMAVAQSSN